MFARLGSAVFWLVLGCAAGAPDGGGSKAAAENAELARAWQLYQRGDPAWTQARARWAARGGRARETLVLNLVGELVRFAASPLAQAPTGEPRWLRARRELLELDRSAVLPILVEALRAAREPIAAAAVADTLGEAGAVDDVLDVLDHPKEGDSPLLVGAAARSLVVAGGERALLRVGDLLATARSWRDRAAAAEALARARTADRERAAAQLVRGLQDEDPFVVKRALASLEALAVSASAPSVALRLERAVREGDVEVRDAAVKALRRLTGREGSPEDVVFWRQAAHAAAGGG